MSKSISVIPCDPNGLSRMKWEFEQARCENPDLLCFGTADMDFRSPEPILQAISDVVEKGHLGYPYITNVYYQTIHDWLIRTAGWNVDIKNCTANHLGIYPAVWTILDALTQPGDEIIYQTPVHFVFRDVIESNGRVAVENPLKQIGDSYTMDFKQLESCISDKTKILWLCNPHNPVGRAWNVEELTRLGELCEKYNVLIVSDDVYCGLLYPGTKYTPIASIDPRFSARTITCYSPSKCYNTTGVKYSFIITENHDLLEKYLSSLHKLDLDFGFNIFGIATTIAAYGECDSWLVNIMDLIGKNMNRLRECVQKEMPKVKISTPDSTYFAWLDFRCLGVQADALGTFFENAGVEIGNGASLGTGGEGFIRLNMACTMDTLEAGLARIVSAYKKQMET